MIPGIPEILASVPSTLVKRLTIKCDSCFRALVPSQVSEITPSHLCFHLSCFFLRIFFYRFFTYTYAFQFWFKCIFLCVCMCMFHHMYAFLVFLLVVFFLLYLSYSDLFLFILLLLLRCLFVRIQTVIRKSERKWKCEFGWVMQ